MCTLTFYPLKAEENSFVFTSNRDESVHRPTLPPSHYLERGIDLWYPKDEIAGGTWVGVSSHQRLVCLMNGGFEAHQRKPVYRISRGVVVKEALITDEVETFFETFNLTNVEPFTLIAIGFKDKLQIFRCVWDGEERHLFEEKTSPQIWSASMTYDLVQRQARKKSWQEFLNSHQHISEKDIWNFHHQKRGDLIIDRGGLKTTSVTQTVIKEDQKEIQFEDLTTKKISRLKIN